MATEPRDEHSRLEPIPYATPYKPSDGAASLAKTAFTLAVLGFVVPVVGCLVGTALAGLSVQIWVGCLIAMPLLAIGFGVAAASQSADARAPARRRAKQAISIGGVQLVLLLAVSILLPTLGRSRTGANRIKSASNLRQIGQALLLYTNEFAVYPPDFGTLMIAEDLTPGVFVNPNSNDTQSPAATKTAQAKDVVTPGSHCSYIFATPNAATQPSNPTRIDAYEVPGSDAKGGNFLFADGHVQFIDNPEAARLIAELKAGHNPPRPPST